MRSLSTIISLSVYSRFLIIETGCFLFFLDITSDDWCPDSKKRGYQMKKRRTLFLLIALTLSMVVGTFSVNADDKTPENEFRVGMETAYAPFNCKR